MYKKTYKSKYRKKAKCKQNKNNQKFNNYENGRQMHVKRIKKQQKNK